MNLAQMRTMLSVADDAITNYAEGNDAFDRQREDLRNSLPIHEGERMAPMPWTPFEFSFLSRRWTVVLDQRGEVVGTDRHRDR